MNMRLRLVDDMAPYSTEDDRLAVFINGECRGVSYRSKMANGKVFFLLHINGDSKEAGNKMCDVIGMMLHYLLIYLHLNISKNNANIAMH